MPKSQPTRRYMDRLAAAEMEQFRERIENAFSGCLEVKAELQQVPPSRRANILGQHMNTLRKELQSLLRESCDVYSAIAIACRGETDRTLLAWVNEQIAAGLALARDEERIDRWVISACDESNTPKDIDAGAWLGPAWLGLGSPGLQHSRALRGNELNGKLDASGSKRALKLIHLRLWTHLARAVHKALFNANQRIEFESKLTAKHSPGMRTRTGSDSVRRARCVAKILEELNTFRAAMQIPQDYDDARLRHRKLKIFKLGAKHPSFKQKLIAIGERRQLISLAQDATALMFRKTVSTVKTNWKRHKPTGFRRSVSEE